MVVDRDLHSYLQLTVNENNQYIYKLHPKFKRLFWEQQVAALEQKDARSYNEMASDADKVVPPLETDVDCYLLLITIILFTETSLRKNLEGLYPSCEIPAWIMR